jgi:hypothetical protein
MSEEPFFLNPDDLLKNSGRFVTQAGDGEIFSSSFECRGGRGWHSAGFVLGVRREA